MRSYRNGFLGFLLACWASQTFAATFYVDQLTDDAGACTPGACSLREAALAANASPGLDLVFLMPGVHELTIPGVGELHGFTGDVNFREPVEVYGSTLGQTVIDGNGIDGVLDLSAWTNSQLTYVISDVTLRGGYRENYFGGGLTAVASRLTVRRCVFEDNYALRGGGLYLGNTRATVRESTFVGNRSGFTGGGIARNSTGLEYTLLVENTTISGNSSGSVGGAIGAEYTGPITLRGVTIYGNTADFRGSALQIFGGVETNYKIESSIVEGTCDWTIGAGPDSLGGNLFSPDSSCNFGHATDQAVTDFGLGPLEPGESGLTHPLLPGSPAIDAGASCPPEDQRGAMRPMDGDGDGIAACDAGAHEAGAPSGLADIPALPPAGLLLLAALLAAVAWRRLG